MVWVVFKLNVVPCVLVSFKVNHRLHAWTLCRVSKFSWNAFILFLPFIIPSPRQNEEFDRVMLHLLLRLSQCKPPQKRNNTNMVKTRNNLILITQNLRSTLTACIRLQLKENWIQASKFLCEGWKHWVKVTKDRK